MLVAVEKDYEKFLCECLSELSKHKDGGTDRRMLFMGVAGDDLIIINENCDYEDLELMATRLNTHAITQAIMQTIREAYEIEGDETDEEEMESET